MRNHSGDNMTRCFVFVAINIRCFFLFKCLLLQIQGDFSWDDCGHRPTAALNFILNVAFCLQRRDNETTSFMNNQKRKGSLLDNGVRGSLDNGVTASLQQPEANGCVNGWTIFKDCVSTSNDARSNVLRASFVSTQCYDQWRQRQCHHYASLRHDQKPQ